ncbi:MAG: hypothetical protein PHH67_09390 [Methanosarcina sp.]|jgi:hypothetical protein|nr:hypothetical protein [Methanosarcina sp.]MDD3316624.1 hypothetical protein [Methanosarcina sp.]MDD4306698.1 hypothetical protein [Methanosarcina sp.]MDD4619417.1 hypothetical protein [Methanosarcina sp.]
MNWQQPLVKVGQTILNLLILSSVAVLGLTVVEVVLKCLVIQGHF